MVTDLEFALSVFSSSRKRIGSCDSLLVLILFELIVGRSNGGGIYGGQGNDDRGGHEASLAATVTHGGVAASVANAVEASKSKKNKAGGRSSFGKMSSRQGS